MTLWRSQKITIPRYKIDPATHTVLHNSDLLSLFILPISIVSKLLYEASQVGCVVKVPALFSEGSRFNPRSWELVKVILVRIISDRLLVVLIRVAPHKAEIVRRSAAYSTKARLQRQGKSSPLSYRLSWMAPRRYFNLYLLYNIPPSLHFSTVKDPCPISIFPIIPLDRSYC